ncbi:CPBP family intramembrane metalloprotease [Mucilaginibacter sp. HMF5004]|uniref:CPBP family intramembrane glutamic endopeptidase n=1 Tax=Mucilaginibacter rivuli TaxID=2857527 RepID=UPI001C5FBFD3|nr:CPBP family intramembrane glutamic endopeptidase [Mucilaginibacter rivuli]MBW4890104.1 CPBP family intramembrane metalloprotease [Mucilaginibacter rivuli]
MTEEAQSRMHPSMQFLYIMFIAIGSLIIGGLLGFAVVFVLYGTNTLTEITHFNTSASHVISGLWIIQVLGGTIPLFLTPVIFAKYIVKQPQFYLKNTFKVSPVFFVTVFAIMIVSSPLMDFLVTLNQKMVLPQSLNWLQQWMREKEDAAQKATQALTQFKTIWDMLLALLIMGLLTAVAEEFLFRGGIQGIFTRWTKNAHAGIWISAILFSAFHVEFFGFLPRMMLGVGFGYFVYYSGSIWTAVLGHFINNGSVVIITYLFQQKIIGFDPDSSHYNYIITTLSLIFTVFLFFIYQKVALSKKQLQGYNGKGLG